MRMLTLAGTLATTTALLSAHANAGPLVPSIEMQAGPIATIPITTGSVSIGGIAATGAPLIGSPTQAILQVGGTATNGVFNPLGVQVTEFNLTNLSGLASLVASISGILAPLSSVSWSAYIDPTNAFAGAAQLIGSGSFSNPSNIVSLGFSKSVPGFGSISGPFSLSEFFTFTAPSGSSISFNSQITATQGAVPEPASLALLGVGLLGLGLVMPLRRNTHATP